MSNSLEIAIRKLQWQQVAEDREDAECFEDIFKKHRDRLIATYCAWMRHHDSVKFRNEYFPNARPILAPEPSRTWCNTAILVLTHCDVETQKLFLNSPIAKKDLLVQAILSDGGMWCEGVWQELPE